ncbi:zinc transporter ZIP3-like [Mya arenaria]|uniref:zinc transporter ZIP3-like n=1 Tax=Mya arenaria TaxID=6604 RepID=UPI0022E28B32|nr:zinc transporter ZIP3-like [Mya arenaria]
METGKISGIFILFGLSFLSGTLSILTVKCLISKFGSSSKLKRAISLLNCFSGGVFFATSILDLLPEARESMEEAIKHYDFHTHYPLSELLLCIGFFLILTVEHFAHMFCAPRNKVEHLKEKKGEDVNDLKSVSKENPTSNRKKDGFMLPAKESDILVYSEFEDSSYVDDVTYQTYGTVDGSVDGNSKVPYTGIGLSRNASPTETQIVFDNSDRIVIRNGQPNIATIHSPSTKEAIHSALETSVDDPARSKLRGIVLLIALSLHMIFDGLALGLLDKESKVWQLLAALALHKCLVFFTIGLQSLEILASVKKAILVVAALALVSPVGVLIGEFINNAGEEVSRDTASAILQGIATGTFLFVTFFEILQRELGSHDPDLMKIVMTVLGFILIALIRLLEHEDHD